MEQALREYTTKILGIGFEADTRDSWEELSEKIIMTESNYKTETDGFWHRLWYGIGDANDAATAWVALIPEAYGLAIVKTGLAVVFKVWPSTILFVLDSKTISSRGTR